MDGYSVLFNTSGFKKMAMENCYFYLKKKVRVRVIKSKSQNLLLKVVFGLAIKDFDFLYLNNNQIIKKMLILKII